MFTDKNRKTIGIIGAMQSEVDAIKEKITDAKSVTISGITFVYGELYAVNVVAAVSGIGKVFAAICTQTMILTFQPDLVVNIGVGGSLSKDLDIADVAIASRVVQHDMDTSALGDPRGLISGINIVYFPCDEQIVGAFSACAKTLGIHSREGVIASGDCFISDSKKKQELVECFDAIVCEMEGASIGHVCYVNKVPFAVLRAISDNGDENSENDYFTSLTKASNVALALMDAYLQTL